MTSFRVSGFEVVEQVGFGSGGEVWLASELGSGDLVALKRMPVGADAQARARLHQAAAAAMTVTSPHVVRLRAAFDAGDDVVLVFEHVAGPSLAALLASRGRLSPGEVVTLAVPLLQALAAIAATGLVHGHVSPAKVLFSADGQPLLSELGVRQFAAASSPPGRTGTSTAPSDVFALAAVCVAALGGSLEEVGSGGRHEAVLRSVLSAAMHDDPGRRPTADELAVAVFRACPPQPISFHASPSTVPLPTLHKSHRLPPTSSPLRTLVCVVFVVLVGLVAVLLGGAWAASDADRARPASVAPASSGRTAASSWLHVLGRLDKTRSEAFAHADPARLEQVYSPGSPALQRDRKVLAELVARDVVALGVRLDVRSVEVDNWEDNRVVLKVSDVMPRFQLVATDGVVMSRPGRPLARWLVTLVGTSGSDWRVYDVVRA